jgi:transposase
MPSAPARTCADVASRHNRGTPRPTSPTTSVADEPADAHQPSTHRLPPPQHCRTLLHRLKGFRAIATCYGKPPHLFKAKTGISWRDLPERYGPWKTVYNRFWRWSRNGTFTTLVTRARVIAEAIDELDREVSIDSSIVRAHQHAAGARSMSAPHTGGG